MSREPVLGLPVQSGWPTGFNLQNRDFDVCRRNFRAGDMRQIGDEKYPVRETARRRLKQVDFRFDDKELRGLEQNPDTKSKWAAMARDGKKVMQFLDGGRYVAVVVDGKMKTYG